ncbi:MAG: response regulator [Ramlibacter sp.]|nr:response regulator [Ramlibacter sp.]
MHPASTLIAQHEPRAAAALQACVAGSPRLRLAGSCSDGASALRRIEEEEPELVCLDVRLPGLPVLLQALCADHPGIAVLLTASEQDPAWAMLELHAVDPLPLPVTRPRFQDCMEEALRLRDPSLCARALQQLARARAPHEILVHDRGAVVPLAVGDIESLQSEQGSTLVAGAGGRYLVKLSLAGFERVLDRQRFFKLHRRCIVNREHILHLDGRDPRRIAVRMRSGAWLVADPEAAARMRARTH